MGDFEGTGSIDMVIYAVYIHKLLKNNVKHFKVKFEIKPEKAGHKPCM